jgi:hypothetical protein
MIASYVMMLSIRAFRFHTPNSATLVLRNLRKIESEIWTPDERNCKK